MNTYTVKLNGNENYAGFQAEEFEIVNGDLTFKVAEANVAGVPHGAYEWVKLEPATP